MSKSSLALKKKQFGSHKFAIGIPVLNKKYRHLESKCKNTFNLFNYEFDYTLAYYFAESETTKKNMNKFLINSLMASLIKKLSYKNANEQMEKLLKIPWGILENKWIEHKFVVESDVSKISGQEFTVQSQNVVSCIEFLMSHLRFQYN